MKEKSLAFIFHSGKNAKWSYMLKNILQLYFVPRWYYRMRRDSIMRQLDTRPDKDYILERVNYYCKLQEVTPLADDHGCIRDFHRRGHSSAYFFDSYEYLRYFPGHYRWRHTFGDIRDLQPHPSILKSRPLGDDNQNSVMLKLVKNRHFVYLKDTKPFADKMNKAIFRGKITGKENRIQFMQRWFGDPDVNCGEVGRHFVKQEWVGSMMTLYQHLDYKFIMCIEGNDVASNLKWVMNSNSLAVMPQPTCETWFMEGKLIPNYHYVEVKPDFSDLKEKMTYYAEHQDEALAIIRHANEWVNQFKDQQREDLISLLVLDKYFRMTGQKEE